MREPTREPTRELPPGLREAALVVLRDVRLWRLPPDRWERLAGLLDTAAGALRAGDADRFDQATVELELAGPVRITRIGDPHRGSPRESVPAPAPPPVRERLNHLIHTLSGGPGGTPDEDGRPPDDGPRGGQRPGGRP
ncbi:CATRA system-associated protein [Streptomyces sp. NPDC003247]|uniref:CATRA system-associated protein n=1 Tax=Streptomyces sp. NPDC003247 TaxID=3364677 RepID=UPI003693D6E9